MTHNACEVGIRMYKVILLTYDALQGTPQVRATLPFEAEPTEITLKNATSTHKCEFHQLLT